MIDNFNKIAGLLKFEQLYDFYYLQVIKRKKDNPDMNSSNNYLIKDYYIYSLHDLEKYKNEIMTLCNTFNARAGLTLNSRNARVVAMEMMELTVVNIRNDHFRQLANVYATAVGRHRSRQDELWIVDIDEKDMKIVEEVSSFIETIRPYKPTLNLIETKNGYHIITNGFNRKEFAEKYPKIEIHRNNPTLLYVP